MTMLQNSAVWGLLMLSELDLHNARRLQNTTPRIHISIHFLGTKKLIRHSRQLKHVTQPCPSMCELPNIWPKWSQSSFHLVRVDGGINDHPCATPQFAMLGDVDEDGMLVFHQCIHNHGTKLQDLVVHVASASGKSAPIGKDHHWQVLATIEVFQSLRLVEIAGVSLKRPSAKPQLPTIFHGLIESD